jgi:5'-3' exonuclease
LFIRVLESNYTEADDFIGYYVSHKKPEERIVIVSNDRDLTQLISEDVIVYIQSMKDFVNMKNHKDKMGYDYHNVLLKKMICGDSSDNIKGIKGVGETTLLNNFPEIKDREVSLEEVVDKARLLNEERAKEKKKPLKWAENIVNRVTDGCQGERIYELNRKIIDLKNPLMPDEAKALLESFMYAPLDPEGRSFNNVYKILCDAGVDELKDESAFGRFFSEFGYLIDSETKEWKKSLEKS